MQLQRAHLGDRVPLSLANWESPWLALNRCISRKEWTRPTGAWIAKKERSYANRGHGSPLGPE
jgi:hypothetical protein